jgi:hypothetical protein
MADTITLDLETVTLGEMAAVELAAGRDFLDLWKAGRGTRRLIAVYVSELRTSATPRSWQELSGLRLLDASSSTLPASPAGAPATSAA